MTHVLDTNVFSALMRGVPGPVRRLLELAPDQVFIPQPVVAEVRYGLARLPRSRKRTTLEVRAGQLLSAIQRVEWNDEVSARFGEIKSDLERRGERIEDFDVAIAAHAVALNAVLATQNGRHMRRIRGLQVEDWMDG